MTKDDGFAARLSRGAGIATISAASLLGGCDKKSPPPPPANSYVQSLNNSLQLKEDYTASMFIIEHITNEIAKAVNSLTDENMKREYEKNHSEWVKALAEIFIQQPEINRSDIFTYMSGTLEELKDSGSSEGKKFLDEVCGMKRDKTLKFDDRPREEQDRIRKLAGEILDEYGDAFDAAIAAKEKEAGAKKSR